MIHLLKNLFLIVKVKLLILVEKVVFKIHIKDKKEVFFSYSYDPSKDSEPNYEKMDKYKNISGDKIINLAKLTINRNKLN